MPRRQLFSHRCADRSSTRGSPIRNVLHVEVRGSSGELWRLATQDAEWWPPDPRQLMGRSIDDAEIAEQSGGLRCRLSDGSVLAIRPTATEKADGPPYWELIGPSGMALEFGPGIRWQISLGGLGDRGPRRLLRAPQRLILVVSTAPTLCFLGSPALARWPCVVFADARNRARRSPRDAPTPAFQVLVSRPAYAGEGTPTDERGVAERVLV